MENNNKVQAQVQPSTASKKEYIVYDFNDVKGVKIPSKIKCSKCGREVMGYHRLIWERVMKDYNGEWLRYQKEWKCGDCKREEKGAINAKLNAVKKEQKIAEAIKLLENEGFRVTKKQEIKVAAKKVSQLEEK